MKDVLPEVYRSAAVQLSENNSLPCLKGRIRKLLRTTLSKAETLNLGRKCGWLCCEVWNMWLNKWWNEKSERQTFVFVSRYGRIWTACLKAILLIYLISFRTPVFDHLGRTCKLKLKVFLNNLITQLPLLKKLFLLKLLRPTVFSWRVPYRPRCFMNNLYLYQDQVFLTLGTTRCTMKLYEHCPQVYLPSHLLFLTVFLLRSSLDAVE